MDVGELGAVQKALKGLLEACLRAIFPALKDGGNDIKNMLLAPCFSAGTMRERHTDLRGFSPFLGLYGGKPVFVKAGVFFASWRLGVILPFWPGVVLFGQNMSEDFAGTITIFFRRHAGNVLEIPAEVGLVRVVCRMGNSVRDCVVGIRCSALTNRLNRM